MDIHRCRFVPYPPQAINALAFSHPSDAQRSCPSSQRLAVGRANGDIEIWNPGKRLWSQETIFRGGKDRSIEGLAWTQDLEDVSDGDDGRKEAGGRLRLFSIGFSSAVTEWDLGRGTPLRHANGNFGALWCLAAQPRWKPQKDDHAQHDSTSTIRHDQYLAAGCEDGTIVLFSTEDGDLRYLKTIGKPPTKKPRTLSITWKDHHMIVAGYSDSHIRVYDIRSRRNIRNMSLGKSTTGSPETLVWAVKCLPNGTILSGDSAGDLKIWDGNNYSLVQRVHCHEADILDIAINANGSMIITCGADRRTVAYKLVPAGNGNKSGRWAQLMHRRFHEHDVKALASFESQELSLVVSGGLDTVPVVMPLRGWQKEYHRTLSHLPQSPQVSSATRARLFVTWWERQVNIWHLPPHVQLPEAREAANFHSQQRTLLAQVLVKGDENITSARMSEDGKYLAVATVSQTKVFQLRLKRKVDGRMSIRPKKLETPASLHHFGARLVAFSPDCHWLCSIRLDNEVVLVRIENTSDDVKAPPQFNKHVVKLSRTGLKSAPIREDAGLGYYLDTIKNISFSSDSRLLAVGDLSGRIATWALMGIESSNNGLVNGIGNTHGSVSPKSSNASESDDYSSDDESSSPSIHGQRWRRNPAGANLPALDAPLLVMSFRPSTRNKKIDTAKARIGSHPTRHTPHPQAQNLSIEEDRLITVTAEHKVVEFRVLQGVLSDWSRRNPASHMPQQFQQIRERAMGCFWDISNLRERLWLYGSTWIFMLDLSQDLATDKPAKENGQPGPPLEPQSPVQKKRKWEGSEAKHWRKRGSGAGGAVSLSESYVAVGNASRKFRNPKQEDSRIIALDETPYALSDEDDAALAQVRRDGERNVDRPVTNGNVGDHINGEAIHAQEASPLQHTLKTKGPASFLSLKYRLILGVVPMGDTGDGQSESQSQQKDMKTAPPNSLEVAIIERPLWDVDLPPRFDGGQDWET